MSVPLLRLFPSSKSVPPLMSAPLLCLGGQTFQYLAFVLTIGADSDSFLSFNFDIRGRGLKKLLGHLDFFLVNKWLKKISKCPKGFLSLWPLIMTNVQTNKEVRCPPFCIWAFSYVPLCCLLISSYFIQFVCRGRGKCMSTNLCNFANKRKIKLGTCKNWTISTCLGHQFSFIWYHQFKCKWAF